jgi:hypothetical protein
MMCTCAYGDPALMMYAPIGLCVVSVRFQVSRDISSPLARGFYVNGPGEEAVVKQSQRVGNRYDRVYRPSYVSALFNARQSAALMHTFFLKARLR